MKRLLTMVMALTLSGVATADDVLVAVASNFTDVANELAPRFKAKTGHTVKFNFGSSGKFVTQIENGAPFEVFLSADVERPEALETKGFGIKGTRFVYAKGTLVLWSPVNGYVDAKGAVLRKGAFAKIAIANPKAAPYGQAAIECMQKLNVWEQASPKLVQGENIAQAHQFVATGNAELGFLALSQVLALEEGKRGSWWQVPAELHQPIEQAAILLKNGEGKAGAKAFLDYLKSDEAKAVIRRDGYTI